ncbi:MAG TPA: hypothetical protein VGN56_00060 [Candidatus Paceibacterota bacterium]|jgi:hypothetical protein|nr:hypothetical protein [Candidatus Paceibacterota bacterium]
MRKILAMLGLLSLLAMGACGTMKLETPPAGHISNGEYFVSRYPGNLPHVQDAAPPTVFGPDEGDQLIYLDRDCRDQMNKQIASAIKSIGVTTARTAIPIAIGGGYGTYEGIKDVTTATKGYGLYGAKSAGGSGAGAGFGGGVDRRLTGNRYTQAGCMANNVNEAKKQDGALKGFGIVFNADAVNGKSLVRPSGAASTTPVKHTPDPTAEVPQGAPR